jgi:hypothetical protein
MCRSRAAQPDIRTKKRDDMVKVLDASGAMILQVKRTHHAKTWWFELQIVEEDWEDLFKVAERHGPQTALHAYAYDPDFWNRLAEDNADALEPQTVPGAASDRHLRRVWPDYHSLQAAYRKHRRPKRLIEGPDVAPA